LTSFLPYFLKQNDFSSNEVVILVRSFWLLMLFCHKNEVEMSRAVTP
jgi:hypothetical protein